LLQWLSATPSSVTRGIISWSHTRWRWCQHAIKVNGMLLKCVRQNAFKVSPVRKKFIWKLKHPINGKRMFEWLVGCWYSRKTTCVNVANVFKRLHGITGGIAHFDSPIYQWTLLLIDILIKNLKTQTMRRKYSSIGRLINGQGPNMEWNLKGESLEKNARHLTMFKRVFRPMRHGSWIYLTKTPL